ncbi:hypothetical protein TeGR_g7599 [Tetraparma gracilis]|uniref:Helicase ATP-binding domain-containing protein n=1 Tax=Tetraparma gracilis TaxID=2962635 RepID=A0ABQ6M6T0_9STRA|nr:hypothetical protein TeGR_g7599 [Tetraparma gracilis]
MIFQLDNLTVYFPYPRLYKEQYCYMRSLLSSLTSSGHCLLEMPTGTGKTVCLLSLVTSYQHANPSAGKLVYCTRTVPEMDAVMEELAVVLDYRERCLHPPPAEVGPEEPTKKKAQPAGPPLGEHPRAAGAGGTGALGLCLSSRRNMCVHPTVMEESDREAVDAACRRMTASWVRAANERKPGSVRTCDYFDSFDKEGDVALKSGVYDLDALRKLGKARGWCP